MYPILHEMLKIGSVSGAYDAPPNTLVVSCFLPSPIAASRLQRSQFDLSSHVLKGASASRSQFPPPGFP